MTTKPRKLPPLERECLLDLHQGQHPVRTTVRRRMRFVMAALNRLESKGLVEFDRQFIPRRVRITKAGLQALLVGFGARRRWL